MKLPRLDIEDPVERLRIALCCRDADLIQRVPAAGQYAEVDGIPVQIMHNGMVVRRDAYFGPYVSSMIHYLKGVHDPQEEKCFAEILPYVPAGGTMLELGCFWAYYSLWFNKTIPDAQNHLVEMNPPYLEVGMTNFALNGARGFFTNAGLAGGDADSAEFATVGDQILCKANGRFIPTITVDGYMRDHNLQHIDLLHCDAQGAEYDMLAGAANALTARQISYLFVSTHVTDECRAHNNINLHHEKCLARLRDDYGYHILAEHNLEDTYSGDGLIVAKAPNALGPDQIEISRRRDSVF